MPFFSFSSLRRTYLWLGGVLFVFFLLFSLGVQAHWFRGFDMSLWRFIQIKTPTQLDFFFSIATLFATFEILSVLLAATLFFFHIRSKLMVVFFYLAGLGIEFFGKILITHPKPPVFSTHQNFSFNIDFPSEMVQTANSYPSGHVLRIVFIGVLLWFLVWQMKTFSRTNKLIISVAILVCIAVVLYSRISLLQHWPTDVIGASLLGSSLACFSISFLSRKTTQ